MVSLFVLVVAVLASQAFASGANSNATESSRSLGLFAAVKPAAVVAAAPPAAFTPVLINCGGSAYIDSLGRSWSADMYVSGGYTWSNPNIAVEGTIDDALYNCERYGQATYQIPTVQPGTYMVVLHFAEIYHTSANSRVFDIDVEGTTVADIDIVKLGGGIAFQKITKTLSVFVWDGWLTIRTLDNLPLIDFPKISAIEVYSSTTAVTKAPRALPTKAPIKAATKAPVAAPTKAPVAVTKAPIKAATKAPVKTATKAPVKAPVLAPKAPLPTVKAPVAAPVAVFRPIRINCGGSAYTDVLGRQWLADSFYSGGYVWGNPFAAISGTEDDALYNCERYGHATYSIPVPQGSYTAILHFSELYYVTAGSRVFDVCLEGFFDLADLDLVKLGGGESSKVITQTVSGIMVTDGFLTIDLKDNKPQIDFPKISAIEILLEKSFAPAGPPPTKAPVTLTKAPLTPAPVSKAPVTTAPVTKTPITTAPISKAPSTKAPVKAPVVAPKTPVFAPKAPVIAPRAPIAAPKAPIVAPRAPFAAPKAPASAPFVAPKAPASAAKPPVVAPKSPLFAPRAPLAAPVAAPRPTSLAPVPVATKAPVAAPTFTPVRINCGSAVPYTDAAGRVWSADTSYAGGFAYDGNFAIADTVDDSLYNCERWGQSTYSIQVPAASNYTVVLHFAEIYHTSEARRVFDVKVEGQWINDIDIVKMGGGSAFKAVTKTLSVPVKDGFVTIQMIDNVPVIDFPKISAIEVFQTAAGLGPAAPIKAPTKAPLSIITKAPVKAPTKAPLPIITKAPVKAPTQSPLSIITKTPVKAPTKAPLPIVTKAPVVKTKAPAAITKAPTVVKSPVVIPVPMTLAPRGAPTFKPILINCGGAEYVDTMGRKWMADEFYTGGQTYDSNVAISGTDEDSLYNSERFGQATYQIPVPLGKFRITIHLAEIFHTAVNSRVFDLAVEDQLIADVDIVRLAGGLPFRAVTVGVSSKLVADGYLTIQLFDNAPLIDFPKISAIEVNAALY